MSTVQMKASISLGLALLTLAIQTPEAASSVSKFTRSRERATSLDRAASAVTVDRGSFTHVSRASKGSGRKGAGHVKVVSMSTENISTTRGHVRDFLKRWEQDHSRSKRAALTLDQQHDVNVADIALTYNLDLNTARTIFRAADGDKNGSLSGQEVIGFFTVLDGMVAAKRGIASPRK